MLQVAQILDSWQILSKLDEVKSELNKRGLDDVKISAAAEYMLDQQFSEDKKYSYEARGAVIIKVYAYDYSKAYHDKLDGMVERQMRKSIKMIGDFWYTCWVDAGQPDLNQLIDFTWTQEELDQRKADWKSWKEKQYNSRKHEASEH